MSRTNLFGEEIKRRRYDGPISVEHVPTVDRCPRCGSSTINERTVEQPALCRHGGHGATERTVTRSCPCGWWMTSEVSEVRPPP